MVRSATAFYEAQRAGQLGVETGPVSLDWQKALRWKDEVVHLLNCEEEIALRERGITVIGEKARFLSAHQVEVGQGKVEADQVVIATGSRPWVPRIPGLELAITSDDVFGLSALPRSALIVGGGVIAMELAHVWCAFGVKVTVLEIGERILASIDEEMGRELSLISESRGIQIVSEARAERVARCLGGLSATVRCADVLSEFEADTILVAAGRVAAVDDVGLEAAGVEVKNGRVWVDERLRTSAGHIYAAGDVTGGQALATVASYEGRVAARNALRDSNEHVDLSSVPITVFTIPPLSTVGLTEKQAQDSGAQVKMTRLSLSHVEGAVVEGETEGLIKIVSESESGRILGAHILGARSEELIHLFALAMRAGIALPDLGRVIPVHPSFSEGAIGAALTASSARAESYCG